MKRTGPVEPWPKMVIRNLKTFWWMGWVLSVFCITFLLPERNDRKGNGKFQGKKWRKRGWTLGTTNLYETPWALVELHTVQIEGKIMQNWLWVEEKPAINVLARQDGKFLVFRQTKYGLLDESYAPVGGMIEPKESPEQAAKRELAEELGLQSDDWTQLGTYRTAVNRGGGFSSFYFADNCYPVEAKKESDDLETQEILKMSLEELRQALLDGGFGEVKWTANVALALLQLPDVTSSETQTVKALSEESEVQVEEETIITPKEGKRKRKRSKKNTGEKVPSKDDLGDETPQIDLQTEENTE